MAVLRLAEHAWSRFRAAVSRISSWLIWSLPEPLRGYLLGVEALAVAAIIVALMAVAWRPSQLLIFIGLLVCGIVAIEATRGIQEVHGTVARDLQSVWYLAVAITLPPAYALLAPIPMAAYRLLRVRRGMVYKRVFSNATLSLAYGAASVAFRMIRGSGIGPQPGTGTTVLTWTAIVAACAVIGWIVNHSLLLVAIRLADREARFRDLFGNRESITADLLEMSLAISLTLVVAINPILMALALPSVI